LNPKHIRLIKQINQFENQAHRDLVFLVGSRKISSSEIPCAYIFDFDDWINLEKDMQQLRQAEQSGRLPEVNSLLPLGKYAEQLIAYYLRQHADFELLAYNFQLIQDKRTLGEIDYLFQHLPTKKYIHLEFALKYYLQTTLKGKKIFLGPNAKDRLSRKADRILNHQVQQANLHRSLLPSKLHNINFQAKVLIKGCLFYPFKIWSKINNKTALNQGWWMHVENFSMFKDQKFQFSLIESKNHWIFPFDFKQERLSYFESKQRIGESIGQRNHVLVVRWDEEKPQDRGFVMANNWPKIQTE